MDFLDDYSFDIDIYEASDLSEKEKQELIYYDRYLEDLVNQLLDK